MRRLWFLLPLLVAIVLSTGSAATAADPPQLRREGRWLVDPQGRVVIVHGLNLVYKHAPYAPPATAAVFRTRDGRRRTTRSRRYRYRPDPMITAPPASSSARCTTRTVTACGSTAVAWWPARRARCWSPPAPVRS